MLADNLRNTKSGPQKIARGEFIIQESQTKRRIDLSRDWDSCFLPGQRVEMSMAFQRPAIEGDACPGCKANSRLLQTGSGPFDEDQNIVCDVCGLTYCRMTKRRAWMPRLCEDEGPAQTYGGEINGTKPPWALLAHGGKAESNSTNPDEDILSFRRVVIVHRKRNHSDRFYLKEAMLQWAATFIVGAARVSNSS